MLGGEHIDSEDIVTIPMVVEELSIADEETMHARLIDKHFADLCSLQVGRIVDDSLVITQGCGVLAEHLLDKELVLRCEHPQVVILETNLLVHRLGRRVAERHIIHSERAIKTDLF